LVRELVAGADATGAGGVPALDHEPVDDPVEQRAVVERSGHRALGVRTGVLLGSLVESDEVGHRLRGQVRPQRDPNVPEVGVQGRTRGGTYAVSHPIHRAITSEVDKQGAGWVMRAHATRAIEMT